MSFSFNFGNNANKATTSTPATNPSIPSFSLTGPTSTPAQAPATNSTPGQQPFSFGNSSTQPAAAGSGASGTAGGLFGNTGQNQQQGQGGIFGGGGGGLFGNTAGTSGTSGTGTGLFGGPLQAGQQQQQQPSTGLFGQQSTAAKPAGGLFGATSQQPSTGGLFGSTSNTQQPTASTSLFGQPTNQQQPSTSLFGQPAQQQQQQPGGGLFGQSANQQQPTGGLFGQSSTQQPSGGLFGQSTNQPPQPLAGSTSQSGGLSKNTKFSELPENVQKGLESIDNMIKQQKQLGSTINTEGLGRAIWQTSSDIKAANEEYYAIRQNLTSLEHAHAQLLEKMSAIGADNSKVLDICNALKPSDGRPGAIKASIHREFPQEFFKKVAGDLQEKVLRYRKTITQLQRVVNSLSHDQDAPSPHAIAATIENHRNALLALAAQLEGLHMRLNGLRESYTQSYRERTNSMRSPFEVAREEKGILYVPA